MQPVAGGVWAVSMRDLGLRRAGADATIMIGQLIELLSELRSRSTRSRRSEADNHQELPAAVREAADILVAIASTSGA